MAAAELARSGRRTLLLESGGPDPAPSPVDGISPADPERHRAWFWPPSLERSDVPEAAGGSTSRYWSARALGGGSAINGLVLSPGDGADYDRWAATCGPAWNDTAMTPWIDRALSQLVPEPLPASEADEATNAVVGAFDRIVGGGAPVGTTLDRNRSGVLLPMLAARGGRRQTTAQVYLDPVLDSTDLTVRTGCTVDRVLIRLGRAAGVRLADGAEVAAPLVVVCAGAVGSASVLDRSGLGPGVGAFVKNHPAVGVSIPWPSSSVIPAPAAPAVLRVVRWSSTGRSGLDLSAYLMGPFGVGHLAVAVVVVMRSTVRSSGRLDLAEEPPVLYSNRLVDDEDRRAMRAGFRRAVAWCSELSRELGRPQPTVDPDAAGAVVMARLADDDLDRWLFDHAGPVYHAVGTCRMGLDPGTAVVSADPDSPGRLFGVEGVIVADTSVFPDLVAGGLHLPALAVAQRIVGRIV